MTVTVLKPRTAVRERPVREVIARGGQGPAGRSAALTLATWNVSGTMAHASTNRVLADNVILTTPPNPTDGEQVQFTKEQAYTGFEIAGNGNSTTVNADRSNGFPDYPCSGTLQYNLAEDNWFLASFYAGQDPA